ncbi:hypothetical protein Scep_010364 [Stephania cephalantha]|uniref:Uncharacterized protein n=1 Tax=Stephania cephalantha TaxID=152367 RepID=A0AAP0JUW6_9MAGN
MTDTKGSTSINTEMHNLHKEWDEALCPICMDHPHNAVLLLCSSYDKGCRPYLCDSSYRHSNCLDRFKKFFRNSPLQSSSSFPENTESSSVVQGPLHVHTNESTFPVASLSNNLAETDEHSNLNENSNGRSADRIGVLEDNNNEETVRYLEMQRNSVLEIGGVDSYGDMIGGNLTDSNLKCPLCRGIVKGWKIVPEARQYLDLKQRSCYSDSCSFVGNYIELRRHARRIHPTARPAVVDPSRQRAWRNLEHQQEYGDIVSAIRSAMPGAVVLGDYVIESGDGFASERETDSGEGNGPLLTSFILYQMIRPFTPVSDTRASRGLSRTWRRYHRSSGTFSERRNLWGENLLGLHEDDDDWNVGSEDMSDEAPPIPRRRRRFSRTRPDEDLP